MEAIFFYRYVKVFYLNSTYRSCKAICFYDVLELIFITVINLKLCSLCYLL